MIKTGKALVQEGIDCYELLLSSDMAKRIDRELIKIREICRPIVEMYLSDESIKAKEEQAFVDMVNQLEALCPRGKE